MNMGEITKGLLVKEGVRAGQLNSGREIWSHGIVGKDNRVMLYLYSGNEIPLPKEGIIRLIVDNLDILMKIEPVIVEYLRAEISTVVSKIFQNEFFKQDA